VTSAGDIEPLLKGRQPGSKDVLGVSESREKSLLTPEQKGPKSRPEDWNLKKKKLGSTVLELLNKLVGQKSPVTKGWQCQIEGCGTD